LSGNVLAYFNDANDVYFPRSRISLTEAISAVVVDPDPRDKDKEATHFMIETPKRNYYFKADTEGSAREWVRAIQKIIFRTHNEGDSVKISLPIDNILDIEDTSIMDFADTLRIKVIDNDESYAVDEVLLQSFYVRQS
jgi:sterol 3beta-glucosyltransferase